MAEYNFKKDIVLGEEGEKDVIKFLEDRGLIFVTDNKDNRYDIIMEDKNGKQISYEIKTDVLVKEGTDTGNMFVETESRGKESGISVTEAKWYVNYFKHRKELWFIKVKALKKLINTNEFKFIGNAGDKGSNTKGYLIPRAYYKKEFKIYKL